MHPVADKTSIDRVKEFAHQYRWWNLAVVLDALAYIAQIEMLPGREQALKEKVAVLVAQRAVTGSHVARYQIEPWRPALTREGAVVHPDQANHSKGDAAHREHGAKGNAAGHETEPLLLLPQTGGEPGPDHDQSHLFAESGLCLQLLQ